MYLMKASKSHNFNKIKYFKILYRIFQVLGPSQHLFYEINEAFVPKELKDKQNTSAYGMIN